MTSGSNQKRLRVGVHYEPSNVDPHIGSAELALQMTNGVFDTLVNRTTDGNYLPGLAESFGISDDECVYTFRLQSGVVFHDGTPLNSEAVAFSLDRAVDPANRSQLAGSMLGPYKQSRIIDEHTLEIELSEPYAMLLDSLSQGWLAPVSPAAVREYGDGFARKPVGTGPFVFDEWVPGKHISLKRNEVYNWAPPHVVNKGIAHLDRIDFVFLSDNAARTAALESEEVDAILYVSPGDAARFRQDPGYKVETWPIRGIPVCMMMNINRPPLDSIKVRQAINYAVDQDALVAEIFRGEFDRAYGPVSQYTLGYNDSVQSLYGYDPDTAAGLLDDAGWKTGKDGIRTNNGTRLTLDFYALPVNFYPEFGDIITRQLTRVGIEIDVKLLQPQDWIRAGMQGDHHLIPQGKYGTSAQLLSFVYHSRSSGPGSYGWSKRTADDQPGFDELLEKAEKTFPVEEFIPLYQEAQKIVMDEALIVPLHCNTNIVAYRNGIEGIRFDAIGAYPLLHDVDIADQ